MLIKSKFNVSSLRHQIQRREEMLHIELARQKFSQAPCGVSRRALYVCFCFYGAVSEQTSCVLGVCIHLSE